MALLGSFAQRLDLRGRFGTAVRDDLFKHPDRSFELGVAGRILRGFLDRQAGFDLQFLLLQLEPAGEQQTDDDDRNADDDEGD